MKIDVEIKTIYKVSSLPLKATATIIFDNCFIIHNVKVVDNGNGPFVSMPSLRGHNSKWRSVCHPMNNDFRKELQERVLSAYQQA